MIEFFFDCGSPATYLAFHNIQPMATAIGTSIQWKPIAVGGVFNAVNQAVYARRVNPVVPKRDYLYKDIQDYARIANLRIAFPQALFPVNSLKVMRGCIWLQPRGLMEVFAKEAFEAYWGREEDLFDDTIIRKLCDRVGVDHAELAAGIGTQEVKDKLRANTDELVARGGFGTPTIFVGDDMYWGNDRLDLVRAAVLHQRQQRNLKEVSA